MEGFSESLSYELAAFGIGVKIVEPGGVLETKFGQRSGQELSSMANAFGYDPLIAGAAAVFNQLRQNRGLATSELVANVIYDAATDGTDRLRYVATEHIKPLVEKRGGSSEEEYMALIRERMTPRL